MNTTVVALQNLYVKLGGNLTDTYDDIADGIPVSDYVTNPDVIDAIAQLGGSTPSGVTITKNTITDANVQEGGWISITGIPTTAVIVDIVPQVSGDLIAFGCVRSKFHPNGAPSSTVIDAATIFANGEPIDPTDYPKFTVDVYYIDQN